MMSSYTQLLHAGTKQLAPLVTARLDATLLLCHATAMTQTELIVHMPDAAPDDVDARYQRLIARRNSGEPFAYIVGTKEFYGLDFAVGAGVLIPRPETELIIDWVLDNFSPDAPLRLLDIGTGSGILAVTPLVHRSKAYAMGTDISEAALVMAEKNAATHNVSARVNFLAADIWPPEGTQPFDLIVSNPPYIPEDDPAVEEGVKKYEPAKALYAGRDGLEVIRKIAAAASRWLRPGGKLLMEFGTGQSCEVTDICNGAAHLRCETIIADLAGIHRLVVARRET